jgi:hypothetical protein
MTVSTALTMTMTPTKSAMRTNTPETIDSRTPTVPPDSRPVAASTVLVVMSTPA